VRPSRLQDLIVGRWGARFRGRQFPCAIGKGGIQHEKREGDGATPIGVWKLTQGMWRGDRVLPPSGPLIFSMAGPQDKWSDDPDDPAYNSGISAFRWPFSHERMRRGDRLYDIVIMTDHNTGPSIPGDGSAIFVHCWRAARHPTAGCVAFRRDDLRWIVERWSPESRLVIRG